MRLKEQEIIEKDIQQLYLGNLRTVEFDLDLPKRGENGSTITWETKDDRFITTEGKVTRPSFGKGDRIIELTATFTYGAVSVQQVYAAKVLEEENDIQIAEVYPINLTKKVGSDFYLPAAAAVRTENNEILSVLIDWEQANCHFEQTGLYEVAGKIRGTAVKCTAQITIKEEITATKPRQKKLRPFSLHQVRLTGDSRLKRAQDQRLQVLLSFDDDQMLYNFRQAAGLDTKGAQPMTGWDSPDSLLRGHTTGHYLSALALCYGAVGDQRVLDKLTYMIAELDKVQRAFEKDARFHYGFLSGYSEEQFDLLEAHVPYPQIWAPYYTLHKIFAGLLDAYVLAGNLKALEVADKLGDWTFQRLSRLTHEERMEMWGIYIAGEFGGMNESLAELARLTGKSEHLQAARFFDNDRLFFPMLQKIDALGALHANQHIPQIIGALKLYELSGEEDYYQITRFFWETVTKRHSYSIGGTGVGEMFQQPDHIGCLLEEDTAESCASYNMLKLTKELFEYEPTREKIDYYERTMFNHILATIDLTSDESTYFMPTNPGGQRTFFPENSCCHGTGLENHFKYGEGIFFEDDGALWINLFISAYLKTVDFDVEIIGDEDRPEQVTIKVNKNKRGSLNIRQPYWSKRMMVWVDGKKQPTQEASYWRLSATSETEITLQFQPEYRFEPSPDQPKIGSLGYGPYILPVLSKKHDLIAIDPMEITKTAKLAFQVGDLQLKPLFDLTDEHYHLYVEKKR